MIGSADSTREGQAVTTSIERRLVILAWRVGALTAVVAAVGVPALWLLFRVATKVGAIG